MSKEKKHKKKPEKEAHCPITGTMELLGGKWTLPIIYVLLSGTKRFKELERSIEGINTRMLVKDLKQLEEQGIISRTVFAEVPPRVEYALTRKGEALKHVLSELSAWGKKHL
jgi:DNA-binding HxlR family transcriptional regulator